MFYCGTPVDYVVFKNLLKYIPNVEIIAKNRKVKKELMERYRVKKCGLYPAFPDVLIVARHVARKFPENKMIKFGMRHGAYHFKDFVSAKRYNAFNYYFVTSKKEVELAKEKGIMNAVAIGFPKIDDAFDGTHSKGKINSILNKLDNFDNKKPSVIFTATWEKSNMSAVDKWVNRLSELKEEFNIFVTLHPWVSKENIKKIKENKDVKYIEDREILPFLMISDVMVGDISSIIAEFCALDKPIITYRTGDGKRTSDEIKNMLEEISFRVNSFEEMKNALNEAVKYPAKHSDKRKKYNKIMFDKLDGKAAQRASEFILKNI
ncbi:MAG: CDP-glycerol glycerophosphotransferase family protein [Calditrichia bacterium]|nr:CDP-glycerol glycerophosphotransferase family protein [Calditrichia bacterium]